MAIVAMVALDGEHTRLMVASGKVLLSISGRTNNNGVVACKVC